MNSSLQNENGPASAPTLPDRGSRDPHEGKALNMEKAITERRPAASPRDPLAPNGPLALEIDMRAIRQLDSLQLLQFRKAVRLLADVLRGVMSEPWCAVGVHAQSSGAGDLLESITELLEGYESAAVNVAIASRPVTAEDIERRAFTLLGFETDCMDDLHALSVLAAEAARDEAKAIRRERPLPGVGRAA